MAIQLSDEERELLVGSLRRMLEGNWPTERAVEMANDAVAVRRLFSELHALGLAELGATSGPGMAEALLIFEELGRASCPVPLIGACVANRLLEGGSDPAVGKFLDAMRAGEAIPAVALGSFDGDAVAGDVSVASGRMSGSVAFVEGVAAASHLLIFVAKSPGVAIVRLDDAGVHITPTPGLAVPPLSTVKIDAQLIGWAPCRTEALSDAAAVVRLATAARAVGSAQRGFDLALEHAKIRRQFGHVIGEFQAIQHKLADCLIRLDGARLSLSAAAKACDRGDPQWQVFADAALAYAGPALRQVLLESHHTLGAIGYAEEHELPRHFRSVHADLVRFGGASRARAALADYLLAPAG